MNKRTIRICAASLAAAVITAVAVAAAGGASSGGSAGGALNRIVGSAQRPESLRVTADRIAADRNGQSLVASGNVMAVASPYRMESAGLKRDADGAAHFSDPTMLTSCTNEPCHRHWRFDGSFDYRDGDYAILRNATLRLWEVPVLWVPYWYYPIREAEGLRMMPGYTGRWGAYLLTKYVYHIAGDREVGDGGCSLDGSTRFDMRWENGFAAGETLNWRLGDYGRGKLKIYYAWDRSDEYDDHWSRHSYNWRNWGSDVPSDRYGIQLEHAWDVTERDTLRLAGSIFSDSHFRQDFLRTSLFGIRNEFLGAHANEIAWEHVENAWGTGVSVSGPLNDFYTGTSRLPEWYIDVAPTPVWTLPINYETENRIGYLDRRYAKYGDSTTAQAYRYSPGIWADYSAFRLDTYHRLSAPFKVADVVSVVPRVGYRGTLWSEAGRTVIDGMDRAGKTGDDPMRSILEGGITFAGRGTAWIDDHWQHMLEPYADVLAQKAWYSGLSGNARQYVFDSIDASSDWSDQFAGRSRNLPYTWCGVTPGLRNAFRRADENGHLRTVFDIDAYAALQCNSASWTQGGSMHRLAKDDDPNYGADDVTAIPGVRVRWHPDNNAILGGRVEYDTENDVIALAAATWQHRLEKTFSYDISYYAADYRYWDFSSSPAAVRTFGNGASDDFNCVHYGLARVGFEHELCDAVVWGPYLSWDCRAGELDEAGSWIDYRTDCLGFRLNVAYNNDFERIDGSKHEEDWSIGFYVYLRAFGPGTGDVLKD